MRNIILIFAAVLKNRNSFQIPAENGLIVQFCVSANNVLQPTTAGISCGFFFGVNFILIMKVFIPAGLISEIVGTPAFHPVCLILQMKGLYRTQAIHGFKHHETKVKIAKLFGISISKLEKATKYALQNNLAWYDENNSLRLLAWRKISAKLGKGYKAKTELEIGLKSKDFELKAKLSLLRDNFDKQKHTIITKLTEQKLNRKKRTEYIKDKEFDITEKATKADFENGGFSKVAVSSPEIVFESINTDVTLSRKGIAQLFHCTSSYTGTRFVRNCKAKGYVTDQRRIVKMNLKNVNLATFYKFSLPGQFFWFKGSVYRRYANKVELSLNV